MTNTTITAAANFLLSCQDRLLDLEMDGASSEAIQSAEIVLGRAYKDFTIHFAGEFTQEELSSRAWDLATRKGAF